VEADHLDFFKDIDDIRHSFQLFAGKLSEEGLLIINSDISRYEDIAGHAPCRTVSFGHSENAAYRAGDIIYDEYARASFTLIEYGAAVGRIILGVPGEHNISNALAAVAVARSLGISVDVIVEALKNFNGTERRFEKKGEMHGVTIIDDYAHHPQEIAVTLAAAKNYPHKKLWCVFQPHTYTRTKAFLDEFAEALSAADEVILADIYAARETDTLGISSLDIARRIEKLGKKVHFFPTFDEIETFILKNCSTGDLLITMGAGDIVKVGERLLGQ